MADQDLIPPLLQLIAEEQQINMAIAVDLQPEPTWQGNWQHCNLKTLLNLPFTQRYDLAIVNLLMSSTLDDEVAFNQSLVRLRDLFARKILVLADQRFEQKLRALGFIQIYQTSSEQDTQLMIWQFNILTYKHVPDWFNSKYWANPEHWDKYRW